MHGSHWRPASNNEGRAPCVVFARRRRERYVQRYVQKRDHPGRRGRKVLGETRHPTTAQVHANSASRAQSCHYLSLVLGLGCSLFAFDCAGSGGSDGAFVTLGYREARDLRTVLEHLAERPDVSEVALWGQSMGAAAALYYQALAHDAAKRGSGARWPRPSAVVLDSPRVFEREREPPLPDDGFGVATERTPRSAPQTRQRRRPLVPAKRRGNFRGGGVAATPSPSERPRRQGVRDGRVPATAFGVAGTRTLRSSRRTSRANGAPSSAASRCRSSCSSCYSRRSTRRSTRERASGRRRCCLR